MILADTSVWIEHFRTRGSRLADLLDAGDVCMHPFVLGELACGNLGNRTRILGLLARLPSAPRATDDEVLVFLEDRSLMGRGLGYIDVHLLAAAALDASLRLWTRDRRLAAAAATLRVGIG